MKIPRLKNGFPFLQKASNKWIPCVIYRPVGLLYYTTVDRKGILAGAILSAVHVHD